MPLVVFSKPHGPYKPGDALYVSDDQAAELAKAGVIEVEKPAAKPGSVK